MNCQTNHSFEAADRAASFLMCPAGVLKPADIGLSLEMSNFVVFKMKL